MVEYQRVIVLRAVYDDSDLMTDYYHPDHSLEEWYVCDLKGKRVTESKLKKGLVKLPGWLQAFKWCYRRGEDYSMSDHPYGQLRADEGTSFAYGNSWGDTRLVRFILTATSLGIYEMNSSKDKPIPKSREEFQKLLDYESIERQESRVRQVKALQKIQPKIIEESHAIIDGQGFRVLTAEEKASRIEEFLEESARTVREEEGKLKELRAKLRQVIPNRSSEGSDDPFNDI